MNKIIEIAISLEYVSLCKKIIPYYYSSETDANSLILLVIDASTLVTK